MRVKTWSTAWIRLGLGVMAAAFWMAWPSSSARAQQAATVTVAGTVVQEGSGQPIVGAMVRLAGAERGVLTDRLGRFRLTGVPSGSQELVIETLGHESRRVAVSSASGQEADVGVVRLAISPIVLDQVQATATRDQRSIGEVAALVDVVDRERMNREGRVELTQALENVPGLVNSAQLNSFQSVMLRGMPRGGNEWTNTLLMIDGVPQTDSRNSARVVNLPINDANAIEVVRGPNSALYGRTAIGGVVNVLTREPTPTLTSEVELQGGEFGYFKGIGSLSGPLTGRTGFHLSGSTARNSGYFEQDFDFRIQQHALYSKLAFAPSERSNGMVSANYVVSDNAVPTPIPVVDGVLLTELDPAFKRFHNYNLPSANYHQEELRATANYEHSLTERLTFYEVLGFRKIQYKFEEDGDDLSGVDLDRQTVWQYPFELTTDEDIFYQEARLRLASPLRSVASSLQLGVTAERIKGYGQGNLIYTDEDELGWEINYANPVFPARSEWQYWRFGGNDYLLNMAAGYAHFSVEPLPWLLVDAGGRYDKAWLRNVERFRDGEPETRDGFEAFSPKLSTTFRLLRDRPTGGLGRVTLNAYATYSEAFLPPRVPSGLRVADADNKLVPEDVTNYEAGLKGALLDGRVTFEGGYFQMTRDGIIVSTREGPFFRPSNAGSQDYKGFETAATWAPGYGLSIFGNAAFYKHRFGEFVIQHRTDPSRDVHLTGNWLPFSPERVLNAGVDWTHDSGLGLNLNVKNMGQRYVDQTNIIQLDPTTLVDAAVSWRRDRLRLTLAAQNLLNQEYITSGSISSASSVDPAAPRQIRLIGAYSTR
jgi:outer membrane receptor protein involved in Fe transport